MTPFERTYSALIVTSADHIHELLRDIMSRVRLNPLKRANSISTAQRIMVQQSFDLVIIDAPLPDDAGLRFALDAAAQSGTIVLLLVRAEQHSAVYAKVSRYGIFTLAKPFSRQTIDTAFQWMVSARERLRQSEKKTVTLEEKMEEIRLVNRAKWLLIDRRQMDEGTAHRYIEKQAMDSCSPRREIAKQIIQTYSDRKR